MVKYSVGARGAELQPHPLFVEPLFIKHFIKTSLTPVLFSSLHLESIQKSTETLELHFRSSELFLQRFHSLNWEIFQICKNGLKNPFVDNPPDKTTLHVLEYSQPKNGISVLVKFNKIYDIFNSRSQSYNQINDNIFKY